MTETLKVALVLAKEARTAEGRQRVLALAEELGLTPTLAGRATLSFEAPAETCRELFTAQTRDAPASEPAEIDEQGLGDFGAPAGAWSDSELTLPPELAEDVLTASIEPPARRLAEYRSDPEPELQRGWTDGSYEEVTPKDPAEEE